MNKFRLNPGLVFASWALLLVFGCHKKRPNIPPEETPPTIISQVPTAPAEEPAQQQNPPSTPEPQTANNKPPEKPARTARRPKSHAAAPKKPVAEPEKPAPTEEAKNISPPRVVIQEGGSNPGSAQASAGTVNDNPGNQASTQQLLESAENNLRNIKRQLSPDEKSALEQIRDFIEQSKKATKDGDNVRAHVLALKARLLSDELAKAQ